MKAIITQNGQDLVPEVLPVVPTMDVVVFPHIIVPLLVLDEKIISGINQVLETSKMVLLLAAKDQDENDSGISTNDLHQVGTVGSIMRIIKIPEGGLKVLVQGVCKAKVHNISSEENMLHASIEKIEMEESSHQDIQNCIVRIKTIAEKMATSGYAFSPDFHAILSKMQDPQKIGEFILTHLNLSINEAQILLETATLVEFLTLLGDHLHKEVNVAEVQEKIRSNAREAMNQSQKEYYLREQLRAIKQELGEDDLEEIEEMHEKLDMLNIEDDITKEIRRQINRLERTAPDSLEATVTRNYLEWIFALPWNNRTKDNLDLTHVKTILDEDHYGLTQIKDRILDFISVKNLKKDGYAPILCFVGPPGTGKTSLGKSIARSLGRKYARISLGGVKDEAEIRGHRRTYVGAMPGRFIQAIRKAGTKNPLLLIDEIDKMASDFRGDPSAAMLEVLDPNQNKTFYDNYLGVTFDFSEIMFVATANSLDTISEPLKDRMEIIELSGYTIEEKVAIAQRHLTQKAITDAGMGDKEITLSDDVIKNIITNYTRESGVRQLERYIKTLACKAARTFVEKKEIVSFDTSNVYTFLGPQKFLEDDHIKINQVGISNGLAWTMYGGQMLKIEAVLTPGKGKLLLTGQLGDVMKESAQAALTYARAHADEFCIDKDCFDKHDLHIHVPEGAVPKDGPSAGITMLAAILSTLTNRPINADYAMTGELNLRGHVMPIGGVKEKILAAKRNNIHNVILPNKNKHHVEDIADIIKDMKIIFVEHANEVLDKVLMPSENKTRKVQ